MAGQVVSLVVGASTHCLGGGWIVAWFRCLPRRCSEAFIVVVSPVFETGCRAGTFPLRCSVFVALLLILFYMTGARSGSSIFMTRTFPSRRPCAYEYLASHQGSVLLGLLVSPPCRAYARSPHPHRNNTFTYLDHWAQNPRSIPPDTVPGRALHGSPVTSLPTGSHHLPAGHKAESPMNGSQ